MEKPINYMMAIILMLAGAGIFQMLERSRILPETCIVERELFEKARR